MSARLRLFNSACDAPLIRESCGFDQFTRNILHAEPAARRAMLRWRLDTNARKLAKLVGEAEALQERQAG
jgi:hypothetical protein